MSGIFINIAAPDGGTFRGYLCLPPSGKGPGLVVEQEIFGINENVRLTCEAYAKLGFVTLAPDLFWRMEPNVDLGYSEADWKRALEFLQKLDVDQGMKDIATTINALRSRSECTGKVGCIGYCLGGKLAFLSATRTDSDASVGYYPVGIDSLLDEKASIKKPLMIHIAERDRFVPPPAQAKIKAALQGQSLVEVYSYPNVDHAFARYNGDHYDQAAAELANSRSLAFLKKHLLLSR